MPRGGFWPEPSKKKRPAERIADALEEIARSGSGGGGSSADVKAALERVEQKLGTVIAGQTESKQREEKTLSDLTNLTNEVAETEGAVDSALLLIQRLADEIRSNANDPVALAALADRLNAQQQKIADAVAANPAA